MNPESSPALPRRVLVTGVTGLVGSNVAAQFASRGVEVIGICRREVRADARIPGVQYHAVAGIGPETRWEHVLRDVDVVVHAAAHAHVMAPSPTDHAAYQYVNVAGTRALASAALEAGVARFVFISSIKVNGEATPKGPFRASDVPAPRDAFGRCKLGGEQAVQDVLPASKWTIVRPPLVYGRGMRGNFARMAHLVSTGLPLPFASIANRRSLVGVENLADLVVLASAHHAASGRVWLAADGEDVSTPALIRAIAREIGLPARLWPFPSMLLRSFGAIAGRRAEMRRLTESLYLDIEPTQRELGWAPRVPLQVGLANALESYRVAT